MSNDDIYIQLETITSLLERQSKASSASLILELLEPLRTASFRSLCDDIQNPDIKVYDPKEIELFLNHFEDIATLTNDGTLDENQVVQFFGANLRSIRDNWFIQEFIKKWTDKDPTFYFTQINKLVEKLTEEGKI